MNATWICMCMCIRIRIRITLYEYKFSFFFFWFLTQSAAAQCHSWTENWAILNCWWFFFLLLLHFYIFIECVLRLRCNFVRLYVTSVQKVIEFYMIWFHLIRDFVIDDFQHTNTAITKKKILMNLQHWFIHFECTVAITCLFSFLFFLLFILKFHFFSSFSLSVDLFLQYRHTSSSSSYGGSHNLTHSQYNTIHTYWLSILFTQPI